MKAVRGEEMSTDNDVATEIKGQTAGFMSTFSCSRFLATKKISSMQQSPCCNF